MYKDGDHRYHVFYKTAKNIIDIPVSISKGNWLHLLGVKDAREFAHPKKLVELMIKLEAENIANEANPEYKNKYLRPNIFAFTNRNGRFRFDQKRAVATRLKNIRDCVDDILIPVDNKYDYCFSNGNLKLYFTQEQLNESYFPKSLRNTNFEPEHYSKEKPLVIFRFNNKTRQQECIFVSKRITQKDRSLIKQLCVKKNERFDFADFDEKAELQIQFRQRSDEQKTAMFKKQAVKKYIKKVYNQGFIEKATFLNEIFIASGYTLSVKELEKGYSDYVKNDLNSISVIEKGEQGSTEVAKEARAEAKEVARGGSCKSAGRVWSDEAR